jgi:hypothetical protein
VCGYHSKVSAGVLSTQETRQNKECSAHVAETLPPSLLAEKIQNYEERIHLSKSHLESSQSVSTIQVSETSSHWIPVLLPGVHCASQVLEDTV